jgi:hypothetical protein
MQQPIYSAQDEMELMARLWSPTLKDDPLAFVLYTFPWGQQGTPLEHFPGPRKWQRQILSDLRDHIKQNNGKVDFDTARLAIASGRGIGKSALVSWLTIWMLSSRIGSTTIVSANSEAQLRSVTWAEITKWLAMSLNSHWFEIAATRIMPAKWLTELVERDLKKGTRYWSVEGRLWSEENPDAYAGVHNFDGVMLIFDEASGIPDSIWSVRTVSLRKIRHIASIWPFPTRGVTLAISTRRFTASARSGKHASSTHAMSRVQIKTCISALSTNMGLTATKPASKSTVISRLKATISSSAAL